MTLDRTKIEAARSRAGLTQEEISQRATVSLRTVQRALAGNAVRPHMAKQIATVLGVNLADVMLLDGAALEDDMEHVLAWKARGGMSVIRALADASIQRIVVEAEPKADAAEDLLKIVEALSAMDPTPDDPFTPYDAVHFPDRVEQVRLAADINARLDRISSAGIAIYVGAYLALDRELYFDGGNYVWTRRRHPANLSAVTIVVAPDAGERILVPVGNRSPNDPALKKHSAAEGEEDDLPF